MRLGRVSQTTHISSVDYQFALPEPCVQNTHIEGQFKTHAYKGLEDGSYTILYIGSGRTSICQQICEVGRMEGCKKNR